MISFLSPVAVRSTAAKAVHVLLLVGAAVALSGCKTARQTETIPYPTDYRKRHPIVMKEGERTVEVFIGSSRGGLTPQQRGDVAAFAHEWKREAAGGVIIDVPAGTRNAYAAGDAVREIRSVLVASGVPEQGISVRPAQAADPREFVPIRLNYPKVVAEVGPCGTWPSDLGPVWNAAHGENRPYWNLGCASQRNLAAMVANPADLVQPRGEGAVYEGRRSVVLGKYRRGESTAAANPDADKGKISDLGR